MLELELKRFAKAPEGHLTFIMAYEAPFLLFGGTKSEMQEDLRAKVSEIVSDLANEILKAQGK